MKSFKLAFVLILIIHLVHSNTVIVETETGPIRGKNNGKVDAYLGIPYAEPPVGELRFAKPVPKKPWSEIYDATNFGSPCVQMDYSHTFYVPDVTNMSENCLFLNVWVPPLKCKDELKAVMLFIHGGGFILGSSNVKMYHGDKLAEHGDVIVVTINYRLGFLGMFTTFNDEAPGSVGLYDQLMAMKWVKDNAKHFHGDPDNIVIFGESAGGFSISLHQISPLSQNLYKRAIVQSGSTVNPLHFSDKNELVAKTCNEYALLSGCIKEGENYRDNPSDTIDCLRKVPAEKFPQISKEIFKKGPENLLPRVGNDFLPENTLDMFRKGHFKDSEVMMGIVRDEGSLFMIEIEPDIFGDNVLGDSFNETTAFQAIKNMVHPDQTTPDEINGIAQSYLDEVSDKKGHLAVVSEAVGDFLITCAHVFQAEYHAMRGNPVYFYLFDHRDSYSRFSDWMGVFHGAELQYVFGNPIYGASFNEYEEELSRDMMQMWAAFAKTGNPTIPGGLPWPRYSHEDPKYIIIGKRDKIKTRPDDNRCERWRNLFQSNIDDSVIQALKKT